MSLLAVQRAGFVTPSIHSIHPVSPGRCKFGPSWDGSHCLQNFARKGVRPRLPERFVKLANDEGESGIYLFEICAAIITVCVAKDHHDGAPRSRVLFIDNQSALDSLVRGSSTSELGTILVGGVLEPGGPGLHSVVDRVCQHKFQRCGRTFPRAHCPLGWTALKTRGGDTGSLLFSHPFLGSASQCRGPTMNWTLLGHFPFSLYKKNMGRRNTFYYGANDMAKNGLELRAYQFT